MLKAIVAAAWAAVMTPWRGLARPLRVERWSGKVTLPDGYRIRAGQVVEFDPRRRTTVEARGNVIVEGTLRMRPRAPGIVHTLRFVDVDEQAFVGGGMEPLATDVGLWVMEGGRLDAAGSHKRPWTRARAAEPGDDRLQLLEPPVGWRVGDTVAVTPTVAPGQEGFRACETRRVQAIDADTVTLNAPLLYAHPAVDGPLGRLGPEVLNLTRNVRICGTQGGRSHVFLRPDGPQTISDVELRHVGPRKDGRLVLGRYGVHFHMAGNRTRGSTVSGVVVRDSGSHAFVSHASHGIRFRGCIAFATVADAYWWDRVPPNLSGPGDAGDFPETASNDITFDTCVAAGVSGLTEGERYRLCGFSLGRGVGLAATGCVAAAVEHGIQGSGFHWPENNGGAWAFDDCVAHNNEIGAFFWQNNHGEPRPPIRRFAAYHNGQGIHHGAYRSVRTFEDCWCFANERGGVVLAAQSPQRSRIRYRRCTVDGGGLADFAVRTAPHNFSGGSPTRFERCSFAGARIACVGVLGGNREFDLETFKDCGYEGNEFWLAGDLAPPTEVVVDDARHGRLRLRPVGQPGTFDPNWNANVTQERPPG